MKINEKYRDRECYQDAVRDFLVEYGKNIVYIEVKINNYTDINVVSLHKNEKEILPPGHFTNIYNYNKINPDSYITEIFKFTTKSLLESSEIFNEFGELIMSTTFLTPTFTYGSRFTDSMFRLYYVNLDLVGDIFNDLLMHGEFLSNFSVAYNNFFSRVVVSIRLPNSGDFKNIILPNISSEFLKYYTDAYFKVIHHYNKAINALAEKRDDMLLVVPEDVRLLYEVENE